MSWRGIFQKAGFARPKGRGYTLEHSGRIIANNIPDIPGDTWYVNAGVDASGDGRSWQSAFKTLIEGLAAMTNWDTCYVAPGGYAGDFQTPLNATASFCRLFGVNGGSFGVGPYLSAATSTEPILDIRARGWLIAGFELDLPATGKGFQLNENDVGCRADFTQIEHCMFYGAGSALFGIDFYGGHNVWSKIYNNDFTGIYNGSGTGQAIGCSAAGNDLPSNADIAGNHFLDNDKHIGMNGSRGLKSSRVHHNVLVGAGVSKTATKLIDLTNGNSNHVFKNSFGGTYSISGGYKPGTNDNWAGNYHMSNDGTYVSGGVTIAVPA